MFRAFGRGPAPTAVLQFGTAYVAGIDLTRGSVVIHPKVRNLLGGSEREIVDAFRHPEALEAPLPPRSQAPIPPPFRAGGLSCSDSVRAFSCSATAASHSSRSRS